MDLDKLAREIKAGEWEDLLSSVAASNALKMTAAEIRERLTHACGLEGGPVDFNSWFDIYWTAGWVNALLDAGVAPASTVLEIGAGLSSNFVRAASSLLGSRGRFVTINLNRRFSEDFTRRNRQLPIRLRCVEGNALHVHEHLAEEACAFIAFNHQINDLVQTILFEQAGHTTEDADWYAAVPRMIELVHHAAGSGKLETSVRPQFLQIIASCGRVLKKSGVMGFNNAVTPLLLRLGYTEELLGSFVPLARRWLADGVGWLKEETFPGFDRKWWLFCRKV